MSISLNMPLFNCVKYTLIAYLVIIITAEMSFFGLLSCAPHILRDIVNKVTRHENGEGDSKFNCITTVDCDHYR